MRECPFQPLFRGELQPNPANLHSLNLIKAARTAIRTHFGENPDVLTPELFRLALGECRSEVAQERFQSLAAQCLHSLGFQLEGLMLDLVRFRAVSPGLEKVEAAKPVFYCHRDTWYGNPSCQVNAWIPLHDVNADNSFRFFPDYFQHPIDNDSQSFRALDFEKEGGFGRVTVPTGSSSYPRATVSPEGTEVPVEMLAGDILLFSAAQLHQTSINVSSRTRFSLDFRFFREDHLREGQGAPDPDNQSQGLSLSSFRPARQFLETP